MIHRNLTWGDAVQTDAPLNPEMAKGWFASRCMVNGMGACCVGKRLFVTARHVVPNSTPAVDYQGLRLTGQIIDTFKDSILIQTKHQPGPFVPIGKLAPHIPIFTCCNGFSRGEPVENGGNIIGWNRSQNLVRNWAVGRVTHKGDGGEFYSRFEGDPNGSEGFGIVAGDSGSPVFQIQDDGCKLVGVWVASSNPDRPIFGDINTAVEVWPLDGVIPAPKPESRPEPEPEPQPEKPRVRVRQIFEMSVDDGKTWEEVECE